MKYNKLMVAGPTEIEEDVRLRGADPMVYNRTTEFSAFLQEVEENLKTVFQTKNNVFILSSSGTGAMEAAVINFLSPGDEVVIVAAGTFGYRWLELGECYQLSCKLIAVKQGKSVDPNMVKEALTEKTKAVFITANETSTGVLTDIESIGKIVKDSKAILVVDAVSSLVSDNLETDAWFCDVVITASQKALAIPPGLSFISVSEKAWRKADESKFPKYYFDLKKYNENIVRGQTPFTPPISLLYQLDLRLKKIINKGVASIIDDQRRKITYLREGLERIGLKLFGSDNYSSGVVGILFDEQINAFDIVQRLSREYAIEITPSPGDDKSRIARIGIFGNITYHDIDDVIHSFEQILQKSRQIEV